MNNSANPHEEFLHDEVKSLRKKLEEAELRVQAAENVTENLLQSLIEIDNLTKKSGPFEYTYLGPRSTQKLIEARLAELKAKKEQANG